MENCEAMFNISLFFKKVPGSVTQVEVIRRVKLSNYYFVVCNLATLTAV